jgi:hypothetical protein
MKLLTGSEGEKKGKEEKRCEVCGEICDTKKHNSCQCGASLVTKPKKEQPEKSCLYEKLAEIEHERWADWQKWCHKILRENCPSPELEKVLERWDKQIATPYKDLTEKEKQSDREQVDRYWHLIEPKEKKEEKRTCEDFYIRISVEPYGDSPLRESGNTFDFRTAEDFVEKLSEIRNGMSQEVKQSPKVDWEGLKLQDGNPLKIGEVFSLTAEGVMAYNRMVDIVRSLYEKVEGEKK